MEKEKGRIVFEKTVRAGIDPGLVEYTQGNVFKTRVFPIPAQGKRTIRVRFISELLSEEKTGLYQLPLHFEEIIPSFHLRVEVCGSGTKPDVRSAPWEGLYFEGTADSLVAEISRQDEALHHGLLIAFPHVENPPPAVEQNSDGNTYFTFFDDAPRVLSDEMIVPQKVIIYWDASASREGAHHREMELLRRWFAQFQDRTMDVDLIPFRDALDEVQSFTIRNGNGEALLTAIGVLDYDGATRLSSASLQNGNADLYFLFSDGLNTLEDHQPANGFDRPLYVVSDAVSAAHHVLRFQAAQSGGSVFQPDPHGHGRCAAAPSAASG